MLHIYIYIYIYIYDISSLRVNTSAHCSGRKQVKGECACEADARPVDGPVKENLLLFTCSDGEKEATLLTVRLQQSTVGEVSIRVSI